MKRWLSLSTLAAIAVGTAALVGSALPAAGQVALPAAVFSGYSTGTAVHVGALQAGNTRIANADEAFSGASVGSQGLNKLAGQGPGAAVGKIVNEMQREVQGLLPDAANPKAKGTHSYARGAGLEVDLGGALPGSAPTIPINTVKVSNGSPISDSAEIGPIKASPLAFASLLKGTAAADWATDSCIIGKPISQGKGLAADAQLLNTGTALPSGQLSAPVVAADAGPNSTGPNRTGLQSLSQTVMVPQTDSAGKVLGQNFGLGTETRQTLAPVTLFKGTPTEVTIEIAGEWVLQAVAGGVPGSAWVNYAPAGSVTPTTPLIRIIQPNNSNPITKVLNTQDLFGAGALPIPLINIPGVAEITVGENARAIGGAVGSKPALAADGTSAAAAVDVVRVRLLDGSLGDIRIGHLEAKATAPVGGIQCPIPVAKTANPPVVVVGQKFTWNVTVNNTFDCVLDPVKVTDTIDPKGITYTVLGTSPKASSAEPNKLIWDNIGPIPAHGQKTVSIDIQVAGNSIPGLFTNTAAVDAICASGSGVGLANVKVPLFGNIVVQTPRVNAGVLPFTGIGSWWRPVGLVIVLAGLGGLVAFRRPRTTS